MKQIFFIAALFFCLSCQSTKEATVANQKYKIESLVIMKSPCFGTCPMYTLEIKKEGDAYLDARNFLKNELKGKYTAQFSKENMAQIAKELNEMDFPSLSNTYGNVSVTDLPATDLTIQYNGGSIKKIHDYGNHGTPALEKFYMAIDSMLYMQTWEKVK